MKSVLIVDDHRHLVESLMTVIPWASLGLADVHGAYSGTEALELLRRERIDLLLTDIRMPGMNGLELIEQARELNGRIHCVLLTGYAEFEYARRAIELQAFRYLMKPVRPDELIACVRLLTAGTEQAPVEAAEARPPIGEAGDAAHAPSGSAAREAGAGKASAASEASDFMSQEGVSRAPSAGAADAEGQGAASAASRPAEARTHQLKLVEAVHRFVREHLADAATLSAIAAHVHLHPVYLSRWYKDTTGKNLSEYILEARMERARELLADSALKIYEIGQAVGYRSAQHFITEFKKAVGVTPKAYRDG